MSCPFCGADIETPTGFRERELGYIVDVSCENGHHGTLTFPKATNLDHAGGPNEE